MRTAFIIMRKDLRRRLRSPLALIIYLLFPFIFSGLMALAFGGSSSQSGPPRFGLALVNQDTGLVGGLLVGAFENEKMEQYFDTTVVDSLGADELIRDNEVGGAIVIPPGFTKALLYNQATGLKVLKSPSQMIAPMAIEEVAELIAMALDGFATVLAEPLSRITTAVDGESTVAQEADVAEISVMVHRAIEGAIRYGWPPAITLIETDNLLHPEQSSAPDTTAAPGDETVASDDSSGFLLVFKYVLPGMGTFALIVLALGFLGDIPRERSLGTLARQMTAPVSLRAIITGKLLAVMVMALLIAVIMAVIGAWLLKIEANLIAFLVLCVVFVFSITGFLLFFFSFSRSESQGATSAWIVMMVMSMLGGSWIPLSALPSFVTTLAKGTLNYWAIKGFTDLFFRNADLAAIVPSLLVCGITGLIGLFVGSWCLERKLSSGV